MLFNRSATAATMSVKWKDLNIVGAATVRDLWAHTDLGSLDSMYTTTVPSHGVVMLKVVGTQTKLPEVFECEYGWINNFNLSQNNAVVANQGRASVDANCSGRGKAGWLGNGASNNIEFRDIYANFSGKYNLTLTYISGENRTAVFNINGKDTTITGLNSGGWTTLKNITFPVKLNAGYNTIRISNATGWLPDLDKIAIDLNKSGIFSSIKNVYDNSVCIYPNPVKNILNIQSNSRVVCFEVLSINGSKLLSVNSDLIDVSALKQGIYLAKVETENNSYIQQFVKI